MKKILSLVFAFLIVFQSIGIHVCAEEEVFYSDYDLISKCHIWLVYGSREYGYFDKVEDTAVKCMPDTFSSADDSAVIDFNIADNPIDLSKYRYMALKYYRIGDYSAIKIKNFFTDGGNDTHMEYGKGNQWYTLVVDLGQFQKSIRQIHVTMYPDISNGELSEKVSPEAGMYIKSIGFYESDPRTEEEKAESEALKAQATNIDGQIQEYGIFEELENLETTEELIVNSSMETTDDWVGSNSEPEISEGAYEGEKCIKVTNRNESESLYYSGVTQNITNIFKTYGAGYYKFGAYIKCDENSPIIGNKYDVRIGIRKYINPERTERSWVYYYSSYTISDQWRKSENVLYIPWDENCISANFIVFGGDSSEKIHSDFYVDKCSLIKYIDNNKEEIHRAYIFPDSEGKFYPDRNVTEKEFKEMIEICTETEHNELNTDNILTGSRIMEYMADVFSYEGNIDYGQRSYVTRAEAVHLINDAQCRHPSEASYSHAIINTFTDVDKSYWAYKDIIEAAVEHYAYIYDNDSEAWKITENNYNSREAKRRSEEIYGQIQMKKARILNAEDCLDIKGTKYYFSNNGNDENNGTSPETPFASIDKLMSLELRSGDSVLFERGSIWRGVSISCVSGVTYGAYGSGQKPKFYGSQKDYADPQLWQETDIENVWETTEPIDGSVGFVAINNGDRVALKKFSEEELTEEYTFYDGTTSNSKIKLYCTQNPGDAYDNIEIAPGKSIINGVNRNNCVFDNLCVMYTGWHGFRFIQVNNITVTNCEIGYIGGTGESSRWGNGIEFWNTTNNVLVKNNYIYQIYDAALTNQYSGASVRPSVQNNIVYEENLIEYSTYGFEFFSNQSNSNLDIMKNIELRKNIIAYTGCGWGQENRSIKDTSAAIKGWRAKNRSENFVIDNNIFYKSELMDIDWSSSAYNLELRKMVVSNKTPQYMPHLNGNVFVGALEKNFGEFNYESYNFDYNINQSMVKHIDTNSEIVLLTNSETDENFVIDTPVIAVENNCVEEGNEIIAVCPIPQNSTSSNKKINLILCLYDGIKESAIDIREYNHTEGAAATVISAEIKIPYGLYKRYEIRAYVLNDNMEKYADTAVLKYK